MIHVRKSILDTRTVEVHLDDYEVLLDFDSAFKASQFKEWLFAEGNDLKFEKWLAGKKKGK